MGHEVEKTLGRRNLVSARRAPGFSPANSLTRVQYASELTTSLRLIVLSFW